MSRVKEPEFFSTDLNTGRVDNLEQYESLFDEEGAKTKGEASYSYLYSKDAVENIERLYKKSRYVVLIRNYFDMVKSYHGELVFNNVENIDEFTKAWSMSFDRRLGKDVPYFCPEPKLLDYKQVPKFGSQISRMLKYVDRSRIRILCLRQIKNAPEKTFEKLISFLGVNNKYNVSFSRYNSAKMHRSKSVQSLIKLLGKISNSVKSCVYSSSYVGTGLLNTLKNINAQSYTRPSLDTDTKSRLEEFYYPDYKRLSRLVNTDLDWY